MENELRQDLQRCDAGGQDSRRHAANSNAGSGVKVTWGTVHVDVAFGDLSQIWQDRSH